MWRKLLAWLRFNLNNADSVTWVHGAGEYSPTEGWSKFKVDNNPPEKITFIIIRGIPNLCVWFDKKAKAIAFSSRRAQKFWFRLWELKAPLVQ